MRKAILLIENAQKLVGYHGDCGRAFDPTNGAYFTLSRGWAQWYARNQMETNPGKDTEVLKAYLHIKNTLVDDDLVEEIGYLDSELTVLKEQGYDSVANQSGSEIFVFFPERYRDNRNRNNQQRRTSLRGMGRKLIKPRRPIRQG